VEKTNKTKHTTGRQTIELFPSILFDFFTSFTLRNLLGSLIVSKIQMTLAKNQKEMRLCSLSFLVCINIYFVVFIFRLKGI
jgi:hypothetical protein